MPRLIHLNGPSRVGKSTLARRYVDDHPDTLLLDLDVLAASVPGWRRDFPAALEVAREQGRELAARHLTGGHDVVLPQLVTVHDRQPDPALEEVARVAGATYVGVALVVDEPEHFERLRADRPSTEVGSFVRELLVDPRSDLVDRIRVHLDDYLSTRPGVIRIDTTTLDEDQTYRLLLGVLGSA